MSHFVLLILALATPSQTVSSVCPCKLLVSSAEQCWIEDWQRIGAQHVDTLVKSIDHLSVVMEGTKKGELCYANSEYVSQLDCDSSEDTCIESCMSECQGVLWSQFVDLASTSDSPETRRGAMSLAFGTFMNRRASDEEYAVLRTLAVHKSSLRH